MPRNYLTDQNTSTVPSIVQHFVWYGSGMGARLIIERILYHRLKGLNTIR